MEEKFLNTSYGNVYYKISLKENSKCLVFTHGLTADHSMFEKQTDFFDKDYSVILWDVPMHGKSRPYKNFSYSDSADVLKKILEKENINSVFLIGQSMGGFVSQMFGYRYPQMVKAFISIDSTPFGMEYYSKSDQWWLRQVGWMSALFPHKTLVKSIAKSVSKSDFTYKNMTEMLSQYSKKEICRLLEIAYSQFLKENTDISLNFPVLLIIGEYDKTGKVKEYCLHWSKNTGYPLKIIKNAAHNSNADNPEDVNKEIKNFIELY